MSDFGSSREVVRNSREVVTLATFSAKLAEMCLNHSFPPRSCGLERPRFRWAKIGKFVEQFCVTHLHHERHWARFARAASKPVKTPACRTEDFLYTDLLNGLARLVPRRLASPTRAWCLPAPQAPPAQLVRTENILQSLIFVPPRRCFSRKHSIVGEKI